MPLTALSALLHAYIALRIIPALTPWPAAQALIAIALTTSAVSIPLGWLLRRRIRSQRLADALAWASLVCLGLFSSLLVLTLLRDALLAIAWIVTALLPLPDLLDRLVV